MKKTLKWGIEQHVEAPKEDIELLMNEIGKSFELFVHEVKAIADCWEQTHSSRGKANEA